MTQKNQQSPQDIHIVLVEDDVDLCQQICSFMAQHHIIIHSCHDYAGFCKFQEKHSYDLLLLDIMLPGESGLAICQKIRQKSEVPVIFLSALGEENDIVAALELGADDYLVKPFSWRELLARIRLRLRKSWPQTDSSTQADLPLPPVYKYCFEQWVLDVKTRMLQCQNQAALRLSNTEFRLLKIFLDTPQVMLERATIIEHLAKRRIHVFDHTLDVQVSRLRNKLGDSAKVQKYIQTGRSEGYMFVCPVDTLREDA